MKKELAFISLLALTALACDDTFDFIQNFNQAPTVFFSGSQSVQEMIDSLKYGSTYEGGRNKGLVGDEFYLLSIGASDPEGQIRQVTYSFQVGAGKLYKGEQELNGTVALDNGSTQVRIVPNLGVNTIVFQAVDAVGQGSTGSVSLFAFTNLPPVADATFTNTRVDSQYEYEFDASKSFDADFNFGGQITQYEYVINENAALTIKTNKSRVKHIFPGPGGYRIRYRVYDNEGATSEWKTSPQINL